VRLLPRNLVQSRSPWWLAGPDADRGGPSCELVGADAQAGAQWPAQSVRLTNLVVAVAWELWLQRHERIFSGSTRAPADLEGDVNARLDLWCRMGLVARSQFERI
jgi:hypothetical protein